MLIMGLATPRQKKKKKERKKERKKKQLVMKIYTGARILTELLE
jgi:hypothetical protein